MIYIADAELNRLIQYRIGVKQNLESIVIRSKKKQPRRVARRMRLRRALRALDRAIADRSQELFTP